MSEEENVAPDAETAIILIKRFDGSWVASNDLSIILEVERYSHRDDVRAACRDLLDSMDRTDLADEVVAKLLENTPSAPEPLSSSIRQALKERDIL